MIPTMRKADQEGPCCSKCIYRTANEEPGLPWYCLEWQEPFMGMADHVCDRFRLDTTRYETLERPVGSVRAGGSCQRTLEEWGA